MQPVYKTYYRLRFICVVAIFFSSLAGFAQSSYHFSPAYDEYLKQKALRLYPAEQWDSLRCAWYGQCVDRHAAFAPSTSVCPLVKHFFGWHIIGNNTVAANYIWGSLSDLSYFSYEVASATGYAQNPSQISGMATDPVVITAHNNNVKVNLGVTLFNNTNEFSTFFASPTAQSTLITNVVNAVVAGGGNGVNIDFEGSGLGSTYLTPFAAFMNNLATQLHNTIPGSQLSVDLGGIQPSGLLVAMDTTCDLVMIMGYDYFYNGSTTAGPVGNLYSFIGVDENVSGDINSYLQYITPSKLVLGMPYYGRTWETDVNTCTVPTSATASGTTFTYALCRTNANGYFSSPHRDVNTFNPYYCYNNGVYKQAFNDDVYSYQKRYDIINQRGLGGAAVWELGYDNGYPELWALVNANLSTCPTIPCTDTIYDMGGPNGSYHNNENYTFSIAPPNAATVSLRFTSFDVEAGYDYLKVYDGPSVNSPLLANLSGTTLPSTITSTAGVITLQFHSDGATVGTGYTAIYTCNQSVVPTCTTPVVPSPTFGDVSCPGTAINTPTVTVGWSASGNASYNFLLSQYPYGPGNQLGDQYCVTDTSLIIDSPTLMPGKLYRYVVAATTDCDTCNSANSAIRYFQIAPSVSPVGTINTCGANVLLSSPILTVASPGAVAYQWYKDGIAVGDDSSTYLATASGRYHVRLIYQGSTNCSGIDTTVPSIDVVVNIAPIPMVPALSSSSPVCAGSALVIHASEQSNVSFLWTGPNGFNSTDSVVIFSSAHVGNSGTYTCNVTQGNCTSSDSISVVVNPLPNATLNIADTVCNNIASVVLASGGPSGGNYAGNYVDSGGTFNVIAAGAGLHTINYNYTDQNGCKDSAIGFIDVRVCTDVEPMIKDNSVQIFPNPGNGIVTILISRAGNARGSLFVTNGLGQQIMNEQFSINHSYSHTYDLSTFANGVYHFKVLINESEQIFEVVISK